jgi:hypothetical protein
MHLAKADPFQPLHTAVFILPTTTQEPQLPKGGKLLGRVHVERAKAIDEAIDYLRAERLVAEREHVRGG